MAATLSQIQAWSTEHLIDAARYWTTTADQWEDVFFRVRDQSFALAWHGAGGDALRERTSADLPIVSAKADQLRRAAGIARNGASDISAAQRRVLYAVEDAQNAGFTVAEDFSVTDIAQAPVPYSGPRDKLRHKHSPGLSALVQRNSTRQRPGSQGSLPPRPLVSAT